MDNITPKEIADEEMINQAFQELLNDYLHTKHRKRVEIITKAFNFANQAHKGIKRRSGEPYIMHPIAVAQIVCNEIGLGSTSICAALLHDVVEDTDYTVEDIENIFGPKIAQIVDGLTKISGGIFGDRASAQADLSIAMGKGSDIAMDTAMITILSSDLMKIPETIRLSQLTVRTIHQNLFWAFIYNLIGVPIAAGILYPLNGFLLNPMIGGAAMAFSSVSVVANSLRLKGKKIQRKTEVPPAEKEVVPINEVEPINKENMKKNFKVEGMMCNNCRTHVEKALNSIDGVKAVVTLNPPVATVEFDKDEMPLEELQQVVSDKAGDYQLHE